MYRPVKFEEMDSVDEDLVRINGNPVAYLGDEYGGRVVIVIDDHCYVVLIRKGFEWCKTYHLFSEVVEALKFLPKLRLP